MKKELTKKQAMFLLVICFVANKAQRLPSLISANVGRHGWIVNLILGGIEILFLSLMLFTNKFANGKTCNEMCENVGGKWLAKPVGLVFAVYFLLNALLPYEAVHEVFSNVLFDHLSWELYSLFIVFTIMFFVTRGLKTIGRIGELFFFLIVSSLVVLMILGGFTTSFRRILPVFDIDGGKLFETCHDFSLWFGDFVIMYLFMGRVKEDQKKMGFGFVFMLTLSVLLMSFAYVIFYGLYGILSSEQTNAISAISQFSLLSLDIGRVDWFLVLFFEISTFISSGVYVFGASKFLCEVFETKKQNLVSIMLVFAIYFLDIFVFKSVGKGVQELAMIVKYLYPLVVIFLPIVLFFVGLASAKKDSKNTMVRGIEKFNILFSSSSCLVKKTKSFFKQNRQILKDLEFAKWKMKGGSVGQ